MAEDVTTLYSILMSVFKIFLLNMLHHLYVVFSHSQWLPLFSISFILLPFEISVRVVSIVLVFSSSYFQSITKHRERHECENTKFACCTLVVIYDCTAGTYVHSLCSMKFVLQGTFCQRMELIDSSTFWVTPGKHCDNNSNDARWLV